MSYDIALFQPNPEESIEEGIARSFPASEEVNPRAPTPEREALKKHLAAKLIEKHPELELFEFDYKEIAHTLGTSEEEAKLRWRHIELNSPEDGDGIQITIHDDNASISIPYWHNAPKATAVFKAVWDCIEVFQREGGYVAFDQQLERILNLPSDKQDVLKCYGKWVNYTENLSDELKAKAQKPWWRFW
jgi:hypothetical protein